MRAQNAAFSNQTSRVGWNLFPTVAHFEPAEHLVVNNSELRCVYVRKSHEWPRE